MIDKHKILTDLKIHLRQNYGDSIKDVILFGSQARGDSNKDSDYDILVILKQDYTYQDERKIINLCYDIDLKYDIIIDVHILSTKELKSLRGKQPIFINALRNGIYA